MKQTVKLLKTIWSLYFFFFFIFLYIIFFPLFYTFLIVIPNYKKAHQLKKIFSNIFFLLTGIKPKVICKKKLSNKGVYIYCSNHTSYLDILLISFAVPGFYHYVGKSELLKSFFFGIFFRTMDIPLDRSSIISSHRALIKAGEDISNGIGIVIFPEGSISEDVPALSKFKSGPFRLAIHKKVLIVPITILDNWKIFPDNTKFAGRPGIARIIIHEPVETTGFSKNDEDLLKEKIFNIINQPLKEYENK